MKKIIIKTLFVSTLSWFASSAHAAELVLSADVDFTDALIEYSQNQQDELQAAGKDYWLAYGIAEVSGEPGTDGFVMSLNAAYALAMNEAYGNLASVVGTNKIAAEVATRLKATEGTNDTFQDDCDKKVNEIRKPGWKSDGFVDGVMATLQSLVGRNPAGDRETQFSGVIYCQSVLNERSIDEIQTNLVEEVLTGTRVIKSAIHDGKIGVVVGYSSETAKASGILAAQNAASQPLPGARKEIGDWVKQQIAAQPGSTLGLAGTRMKKLSNGEWAIVGFSVAPHFKAAESGGILERQKNDLMRTRAEQGAMTELAKFSSLSIAFSQENRSREVNRETLHKEIQRDGTEKATVKLQNALALQLSKHTSASSKLNLRGAQKVYSRKILDEQTGNSYYLAAHAWSPSMLAQVNNFRNSTAAAADRGRQTTGAEQGVSRKAYSSAPALQEDW